MLREKLEGMINNGVPIEEAFLVTRDFAFGTQVIEAFQSEKPTKQHHLGNLTERIREAQEGQRPAEMKHNSNSVDLSQ